MDFIVCTEKNEQKLFKGLMNSRPLKEIAGEKIKIDSVAVYTEDEKKITLIFAGEESFATNSKTVAKTVESAEQLIGGLSGKEVLVSEGKCARGTYINLEPVL